MIYEMLNSMTDLNFVLNYVHNIYLSIDYWKISFKIILSLFSDATQNRSEFAGGKKNTDKYLCGHHILSVNEQFDLGPTLTILMKERIRNTEPAQSASIYLPWTHLDDFSSRAGTVAHHCLETGTITTPRN